MPDYIFDTTVLSNFASVNRSDLLETLYRSTAFTTLEVSDELYRGVKAGYSYLNAALQQIRAVNPHGWLPVLTPESSVEYNLRYEFDQILDPGEASCLALAVSRKLIFITDDLAARRSSSADTRDHLILSAAAEEMTNRQLDIIGFDAIYDKISMVAKDIPNVSALRRWINSFPKTFSGKGICGIIFR